MEEIVDLPIREIDTSSIQQQMARNKEQLQIKLMVRRPISQLIEQGIIPPLLHSPVSYEQTKKLERARTEDYLKHKISNRPNRQELIQHHILEDTNISPMLIAKQQQLKKAKLADNLNSKLSHRPGPLELIKGNILLPSNLQIGQAVKQAIETIEFKPTSCGETIKYPQPSFLILKKDQHTEASNKTNKSQVMKSCNNYHFDHHCNSLVKSNNDLNSGFVDTNLIEALGGRTNETNNGVVSVNKVAELDGGDEDDENDDSNHTCSSCSSDSLNEESSILNDLERGQDRAQSPLIQISLEHDPLTNADHQLVKQTNQTNQFTNKTNQPAHLAQKTNNKLPNNCLLPTNSSPNNKALMNRPKKSKIKIQNKNKIIKFHEYKGPPNAIKQSTFNDCSRTETAYELLLQQQQLYLQLELQLEMQKKQQQLTNHQIVNQRIEPPNQKEQDKTNNSSLIMTNCKSNESAAQNKHNSEPSSPMQISKECSPSNIEQEKEEMNSTVVNTSITNSPTQGSNKQTLTRIDSSSIIDTMTDINKIEEMKVNDLKLELKRFNLPISGSKTTLIERLKNYVSKSRMIKCSTSPPSVESMDIDSRTNSSNHTSIASVSLSNTNLYTNTVSSTPVTTFANVALASDPSNLIGTAFLAQSQLSPATIIRSTFNPTPSTGLTNKPPASGPLIANKLPPSAGNLATTAQEQQSKPRRISEPQLQHIQLHFANPFLQFATAQSSLNTTPLTNRNSGAQQIHFLSTPALNTNDLHLFTQPTALLTSNNRILQPSNTSFTTNHQLNQPTTWTLQPSNNFPQLFFYPTQLAAPANQAGLVATNSSQTNLITTAATSAASSNLANSLSSINSINSGNLCNSTGSISNVSSANLSNVGSPNQVTKSDLYSSDSELVVTSNQQKVRQKSSKSSKQSKPSKLMSKKMSISQSTTNVNIGINENLICSDSHKNGTNESTIILPGSKSNQLTNDRTNLNSNRSNYQSQTNYVKIEQTMSNSNETETKNNYSSSIMGQRTFENAANTMTNSYLQNASLQNYFTTTTLLHDKQPPPYEVATRQSKSKHATKDHLNGSNSGSSNQQSNMTFSRPAINVVRSSEADNLNEQQLNNVIMNANCSTSSINSYATTMNILKQANSMQHDSNNDRQAAVSSNLINATNVGIKLTNATHQSKQSQLTRLQSSGIEFNESNHNLELANSILKQETTGVHHSSELYSNIVCNGAQSFDTNSSDLFGIKAMNVYSSSLNQTQFGSFHYPSSQGINTNSTDCYPPTQTLTNQLINNCINNLTSQTITHTTNSSTSRYQMETECINQDNQISQSSIINKTDRINTDSIVSNNIKTEVDFSLDFDLLMEVPDFFDFENTYNKACSDIKQQSDHNKESIDDQSYMEIDPSNRLTIDTNFDDEFTSTITEQSMHTPTLPEQDTFESQDQVNTNNSMIFESHQFNSISYNDHFNDVFQNS